MFGGRLAAATSVKVVGAIIGVLVVSIGGAWTLGVIGTPSVLGVNNAFGDVTEETTVIETELVVNNPNPIGIQLGNLSADYVIKMNGIEMAEGHKEGLEVGQQGNTSIPFRTEMDNSKISAWWVSHIQNGERTTLTVDASVHSGLLGQSFSPQVNREVNTNLIAAFNTDEDRPIDANKPLVSDPVLWLNETQGNWGSVDDESTAIEMAFDLHNPKAIPITITQIGYDIRMNGVTMGEGQTEQSVVIPSGATKTVDATTRIQNQNLDEWWVTHLQNDQVTTLEVDFYAVIDLSAAGGGTVRIPLDTMEQTIETDMFGNKAAASEGSTDGGSNGADDSSTPADDGTDAGDQSGEEEQGQTETAEPTATPEPSPAPSPTDDGGILPSLGSGAFSPGVAPV